MGKDAFIKQMDGFGQKLQYKHYNEKKNKQGEGGTFKDNEFSGVK